MCSLCGNSEYNFFSTRIPEFCHFPNYFHMLILKKKKKGRYLTTGKDGVKCKTSLIQHDIIESIQLFYLYLSSYILGVRVILTIGAVIFHSLPYSHISV